MLHNGVKKKPLIFFFYADWPVRFAITMINLFLSEGLFTLASMFLYSGASILSFHSCINAGLLIQFNKGSTYVLNMLCMISSSPIYIF